MIYILRCKESGERYRMTLAEIINEINRDRSDEWMPYNEADWLEGLTEWTTLQIIGKLP